MASKKPVTNRESVERAIPFLIGALKKGQASMVRKILQANFPLEEKID